MCSLGQRLLPPSYLIPESKHAQKISDFCCSLHNGKNMARLGQREPVKCHDLKKPRSIGTSERVCSKPRVSFMQFKKLSSSARCKHADASTKIFFEKEYGKPQGTSPHNSMRQQKVQDSMSKISSGIKLKSQLTRTSNHGQKIPTHGHRNEFVNTVQTTPPIPPHKLSYILPLLKLSVRIEGLTIVFSWRIAEVLEQDKIERFVLFAAVTENIVPPMHGLDWKNIRVVDALENSIVVPLDELNTEWHNHFSLLAVDRLGNGGPLSNPCTVNISRLSE